MEAKRAGGGAGGPKTGVRRPKEGRAAGRKRPGSRVVRVFCPGHGPPAPARPQVLLARPARRAGLGVSPAPPGGCPQALLPTQKTPRPLKRVRPPAPPFPRLWLFAIDSAFWGWFLGFPGFWRSRVLTPALGSLDLDRTGSSGRSVFGWSSSHSSGAALLVPGALGVGLRGRHSPDESAPPHQGPRSP